VVGLEAEGVERLADAIVMQRYTGITVFIGEVSIIDQETSLNCECNHQGLKHIAEKRILSTL